MPQSISPTALGVIADIAGTELTDADYEFLKQPELSGLIFFSRNFQNPAQLSALTASISAIRPDLLLCVDQEGGRVQRFREGFTRLPPMLSLEKLSQVDAGKALKLAHELGWLMASEVRACGVHLSFAPVLDIECDCSAVIGDRAFGHDAQTVALLATSFVEGMNEAGMFAVGKHFPGHGAVVADSHVSLPVDERDYQDIEYDIKPFAELIAHGLLAGIMPAHVIYPAVDQDNTAGFSTIWLQDILRQQLGFGGVIFSDDLSMAGASVVGDFRARARAAIASGANALLVCNNRAAAQDVIDAVRETEHEHLNLRVLQGERKTVDTTRQDTIVQRLVELSQL